MSETTPADIVRFAWTGAIDGQPASGRGRGAWILRRTNGQWQIIHENLSSGAWTP